MGDEDNMVVTPQGVIWMLGPNGAVRCFVADGRVVYISEGARASDKGRTPDEDIE